MSLFLFAQSNGHVSSGHLPLAMVVSFATHAVVLLGAPLFPVAPVAPRSSSSTMHVELTPSPGATHAAALRALQRAPVSLRRTQDIPARPPTRIATDAHGPESSSQESSTQRSATTPIMETSDVEPVQVGDAKAFAQAPPSARLAPTPVYPEEARWERRAGRVVLNFHIRRDGTVDDVQVLDSSGHADIDHAALAALREWKFDAPAVVPGAHYRYAFRFDLK